MTKRNSSTSRKPTTYNTPLGRVRHVPKPGLAPATPDEKRRSRRASAIAVGVTAAALAAINMLPNNEQGTATTNIGERVEAIEKNDKFLDIAVLLKQGAKIRLTPELEDGTTPKNGLPNNVGYVVPEGKELVITRPAQDSYKPNWISFTLPGKKQGHDIKETASVTGYANLTLLAEAGKAEQISLATGDASETEFATKLGENGKYIFVNPVTEPYYNYGVNADGDLVYYKDNRDAVLVGNAPVGVSLELDAGSFNNQK